ncbi:MAG: aldo/keto reductase [Spirochaetaceae bacterium]|jgi:predicted aldo/keto reductase-like oxidoreductase|nr:aldo/keto reductase [Spirochaetaceae bacterium]
MIYREYGKTGKKVSLLGFGGMRFQHIDDHDECIRMMVSAAEGGVTYFDTAPAYFGVKSETVFGEGLAELRRLKLPYYVSTKTFKTTEKDIREEIEAQLGRLGVAAIDFYHVWCITSPSNWASRKRDGILDTLLKLKEEGLIGHICVSSHLIQEEIETLLMEGVFEGVLFGYSAYNFKTREKAFNAIRAKHLGAVVMNPLGGGIIPEHPELFGFIRRPGETPVTGALRFLWDHRDITSTLVGFRVEQDVADALEAMADYKPRTEEELAAVKESAGASFEGICTGCAYCDDCPQEIPIPRYMDAYNQKLLAKDGDAALKHRLNIHWNIPFSGAGNCVACGQCEGACTQHLPIIKRLEYIAGLS